MDAQQDDSGRQEKLKAIREAIGHSFPAPDIEEMLAEIEQGYQKPINENQ
jgi:hypothetical protein